MLTPPTVAQLATFTGHTEASFTGYATETLAQATFLFSIVTGLDEYPTDPEELQLAHYAILEMAYRIYLEQPNATVLASPYNSETIGSYSYSKGSSLTAQARSGSRTGLFWWDLAVAQLALGDQLGVNHGSIHLIEPAIVVAGEDRVLLGPLDVAAGAGDVPIG